ncbi:MAG: ABC transporter permease subunit [Gemmataceae bacterium]
MITLVIKLLKDVRLPLLVVALLLLAFQCLWVKITQRFVGELTPFFTALVEAQKLPIFQLEERLFSGPGKIIQTLMGGENIKLDKAMDTLSIGYVHPLMQTLFCIWAIGRAAGAIAGELDRGTMELLLAQPIPRHRVILSHLCVDILVIPILCLSLWAGSWLGTWLVGPITIDPTGLEGFPIRVDVPEENLRIHLTAIGPALWNVAALIFAVSGYTMWMSAAGRFRWWVLGMAVLLTLLQFLINVVGQMWDTVAWLRPFTVFFYYQPQQIMLANRWTVDVGQVWNGGEPLLALNVLAVLFSIGAIGYLMALWTFCRRDLPAPL